MSETNETGPKIILTDICSKTNKKIYYSGKNDTSSPVIIQKTDISSWNLLQHVSTVMKSMFLPKGYPDSVSDDYLEYQIWDTCQAFCSSISGTLTMRAVMHGIGVGSGTATPASAAMTWIMKDGTGMVGSILFAWLKGSKLDSDCKKWRLFADILNDIAMFIQLYIPFLLDYSMSMLCIATAFKALVGTAGSSTRAALITHQAIKENIADVSAKDGSQETLVNLCAFIFGIFILKHVTETNEIWTVMCTATFFHLLFNYKAVKCLKMNSFNSERFCLTLRTYLPTSSMPTVEQVNKRESVFLFRGVSEVFVFGFSVVFGVSLQKVIQTLDMSASELSALVTLFQNKKYFIMPNINSKKFYISLRSNHTARDILKAYFHASLLGTSLIYLEESQTLSILSRSRKNSPIYRLKNILKQLSETSAESSEQKFPDALMLAYSTCETFIEKEFKAFCHACEEQGWNLDKHFINIDDWRADWVMNLTEKNRNLKFNKVTRAEKTYTQLDRRAETSGRSDAYAKQREIESSKKMSALVIS